MSHEVKIHEAQTQILRELLFAPTARFTDLKQATNLDSDHANFHINRLLDLKYIEKADNGAYQLSFMGKEYANKLDTDTNTIERQPKISVIIISWRKRAGTDEMECLAQQRLKNPYFGYWARLGGKLRWGETVLEAAARELLEETGLTADLAFKGLYHKMDYRSDSNEILEDKFFMMVEASNCQGEMIENFEGGRNAWLTEAELDQEEKVFQGMRETHRFVMKDGLTFNEDKLFYDPAEY